MAIYLTVLFCLALFFNFRHSYLINRAFIDQGIEQEVYAFKPSVKKIKIYIKSTDNEAFQRELKNGLVFLYLWRITIVVLFLSMFIYAYFNR